MSREPVSESAAVLLDRREAGFGARMQQGREWLGELAGSGPQGLVVAILIWGVILPIGFFVGLVILPYYLMRKGKPLGAFGASVLLILVVTAFLAPVIAPFEYDKVYLDSRLEGPNWTYLLGTDPSGRDMLSRIIFGSVVTVLVGFGTIIWVGILSTTLGLASGYFGGRTDMIVQRLVDVWIAFPALFLLLSIIASFGAGGDGFLGLGRGPDFGPQKGFDDRWIWQIFPRTTVVIFSLAIIIAPSTSRVIRGSVMSIKTEQYIEAARASGAGALRIMLFHILPQVVPIIIVLASLQLGTAVLAEAGISFLGFGITPPIPTWGQMLSGIARVLGPTHWWVAVFPGLAIFISVWSFNMMGDAMRDVFDPRLRGTT